MTFVKKKIGSDNHNSGLRNIFGDIRKRDVYIILRIVTIGAAKTVLYLRS